MDGCSDEHKSVTIVLMSRVIGTNIAKLPELRDGVAIAYVQPYCDNVELPSSRKCLRTPSQMEPRALSPRIVQTRTDMQGLQGETPAFLPPVGQDEMIPAAANIASNE